MTTVLLKFNCASARCAVKEITAELAAGRVGNTTRTVDSKLRADRFHSLFNLPSFGIPNGFYESTSKKSLPLFETCCKSILDAFRHWNGSKCKRQEYIMTFTHS